MLLLSFDLIGSSIFLIQFVKSSYPLSSKWLKFTSVVFIISSALGRYFLSRHGSHYQNSVDVNKFSLDAADLWSIFLGISSLFFGMSLFLISRFEVSNSHKFDIKLIGLLNIFGVGLVFSINQRFGFIAIGSLLVKIFLPLASILLFLRWYKTIGKLYDKSNFGPEVILK